MITEASLFGKDISELTVEEMSFVHLSTSNSPIILKDDLLRSTLSFMCENIQHGLSFDYSKQLMPYLAMCAILDQLGTCYDRKDKPDSKYANGIKRALVFFAEIAEDDELINALYAFRNGLLHNISLTSYDVYKNKYHKFDYSSNITSLYKKADLEWDGDYKTLDAGSEKYTTYINVKLFKELVFDCVEKADKLNQNGMLKLRLDGGVRQLFYDYIRAISRQRLTA